MDDAGAALLAAAHLPALRVLNLDRNSLGDAGASALATAHWSALQELTLSGNGLGDAGAASLAASTHWDAFQVVYLEGNVLSDSLRAVWDAAVQAVWKLEGARYRRVVGGAAHAGGERWGPGCRAPVRGLERSLTRARPRRRTWAAAA